MSLNVLKVQVLCAKQLPAMNRNGLSDPYVQFEYKGTVYKTEVVKNTNNPDWNQTFSMTYDKKFGPHTILFELFDYNTFSKNEKIGSVLVGFEGLEVDPKGKTEWHKLDHVRKGADGAAIRLRFELKPSPIDQSASSTAAPGRPTQQIVTTGYPRAPAMAPYQQAAAYGYPQTNYGYAYQQQAAYQNAYAQAGYAVQAGYRYPYYQQAPAGYDPSRWQHAVQALEDSSTSSSSSSSDSDSSRKKKKKKKAKKEKTAKKEKKAKGEKQQRDVEAKPELMLEIKDIFPHASYKAIARCLRNTNNDKTEAMKELVVVMEEDNADPRLKEIRKAARGED